MINLLKKLFASAPASVTAGKAGNLRERNREIISGHFHKLRYSPGERGYYVDNAVRDCINEIAKNERQAGSAPGYKYLSDWERYAHGEYKNLAGELRELFKKRHQELKEEYYRKDNEDKESSAKSMYTKNEEIIGKFFVIAYRKVTTIDSYGDENWDAFKKELATLLCKIAEREGKQNCVKDIKKGYYWHVPGLEILKTTIEKNFRAFYDREKSAPSAPIGYSDLNGTEFENYLMNLFRKMGHEVIGTPTTGDQGADMFVIINDKKIAVQVKKYSKPVGNKAIQEVVSARSYYSCDEAWVITNSQFTKSAFELAQKCNVKLIDGHSLNKLCEAQTKIKSVPQTEKVIIECVHCKTNLRLPKSKSGIVKCPSCKHSFNVSTL